MAGQLTKVFQRVQRVKNKVLHERQGDPVSITFLTMDQPTGKLVAIKSPVNGTVTVGNASIGLGVTVESFTVAEPDLSIAESRLVASVEWGDTRYSIGKKVAPRGVRRVWELQVKPTER